MVYLEGEMPATRVVLGSDDAQSTTHLFAISQLPYTQQAPVSGADDPAVQQHLLLLNQLGKAIMSLRDEQGLARFLARRLRSVLGADCCAVVYYQPEASQDGGAFEMKALACAGHARDIKISQTAVRRVVEDKMALLIPNTLQDEQLQAQPSVITRSISSMLCAPLWHEEQVFGLLYVDTTQPDVSFTETQLGLLSAIANLAAIKIDQLRLMATAIITAQLEQELVLAADIQAKFLPKPEYQFKHVECLGFNRPSRQIGGIILTSWR